MLQHVIHKTDLSTRDDIPELCKEGGIGVELGVWRGVYSDIILRHSKLDLLFSIDSWQPGSWSGPKSQNITRKKLAVHKNRSVLLPMSFSEAARIIADDSLDFIYVDGEHDYDSINRDIKEWWPKLKLGGLFSGHDYKLIGPDGQDFGVIRAVAEHVAKHNLDVFITGVSGDVKDSDCGYPSWYLWK